MVGFLVFCTCEAVIGRYIGSAGPIFTGGSIGPVAIVGFSGEVSCGTVCDGLFGVLCATFTVSDDALCLILSSGVGTTIELIRLVGSIVVFLSN